MEDDSRQDPCPEGVTSREKLGYCADPGCTTCSPGRRARAAALEGHGREEPEEDEQEEDDGSFTAQDAERFFAGCAVCGDGPCPFLPENRREHPDPSPPATGAAWLSWTAMLALDALFGDVLRLRGYGTAYDRLYDRWAARQSARAHGGRAVSGGTPAERRRACGDEAVAAASARADFWQRDVRQAVMRAFWTGSDDGYAARQGEERSASGMTYEEFPAALGEAVHTAFRKADGPFSGAVWQLISAMPGDSWGGVVQEAADALWPLVSSVPEPAASESASPWALEETLESALRDLPAGTGRPGWQYGLDDLDFRDAVPEMAVFLAGKLRAVLAAILGQRQGREESANG